MRSYVEAFSAAAEKAFSVALILTAEVNKFAKQKDTRREKTAGR